ncbi:wax ester/triacylglycerol synthase family O-acyltransferase [Nocardioides sp. GY 10127]|uniref:WS/DGAT/MGAT family O-acyltransferase n=1 Tax=Nocardioides sp. GY 10127 TaxID=2569762 RepID=UPI0010A85A67|nr:wax ester/triacylglycerol synthase family O-acyltransferase [Nocardioides sp. GY 10127]TIC81646.1 wax ester/triacylglycerol synthase family O-acyltransferase [Nocardioides sp. GY 10127]
MTDRLRARDVALLVEETASTPHHHATVQVVEPGEGGFDYDRMLALVSERISFVPRYRQKVQWVPGWLANPAWVDDPHFDLGYHVRRSAVPRPGTQDQLRDLVARIVSRPLDRSRPLWEFYVVEGLEDGRVALLSKSHQAMVDGVTTVDLGQVLLDSDPEPRDLGGDEWRPERRPSAMTLVREAVRDNLSDPRTLAQTAQSRADSAVRTVEGTLQRGGRLLDAVIAGRPDRDSAISGRHSAQRRVVPVFTDLADYRAVRETHGGTVNDVVLATVTGGLRAWLMTRHQSLGGLRRVRALAPMSVIDEEMEATILGSQIAPHYVDLPVGEPSPVVRLHQVSYSFTAHHETGRGVSAERLAGLSGFAPTTVHAVAGRVAAGEPRRGFQLAVTNVPGPQTPLYAAGSRMVSTYPVPPLLPGHLLAIGVTSYDGEVAYGITADRDRVPDADVLGQCLTEALAELVDTVSGQRPRAPRGRRPSKKKQPSGPAGGPRTRT